MCYKLKKNKSKGFIKSLMNIENKLIKEKKNLRKNCQIQSKRLH